MLAKLLKSCSEIELPGADAKIQTELANKKGLKPVLQILDNKAPDKL